ERFEAADLPNVDPRGPDRGAWSRRSARWPPSSTVLRSRPDRRWRSMSDGVVGPEPFADLVDPPARVGAQSQSRRVVPFERFRGWAVGEHDVVRNDSEIARDTHAVGPGV